MARKTTNRVMAAVVALGIFLAGIMGAQAFSLGKCEKVKPVGNVVSISANKVSDGKAHFYRLEEGGKDISFFVVKAADGSFKVAFDACDACYKSKKGYEQQGDKMNCKNCNQKFAVNRLGPNATGGCNPGYLPHQLINGTIQIKADDIKAGVRYF